MSSKNPMAKASRTGQEGAEGAPKAKKGAQDRGSGRPLPGKCGAKLRGTNPARYCKQSPREGKSRCGLHGGADGSGAPIKHGRYSTVLPVRFADAYEQALNDPDLMDLSEQFALLDGFVKEKVRGLDAEPTAALWAKAVELYGSAMQEKGQVAVLALKSLGEILRAGRKQAEGEAEKIAGIQSLMETQRRIASTENRRQATLSQFATAGQVMALVSGMLKVIQENVPDATARRVIAYEFARLSGIEAGETANSPGVQPPSPGSPLN